MELDMYLYIILNSQCPLGLVIPVVGKGDAYN